MLGAGSVTSLELDSDAIQDLQDNITEFEIDNIDIIQCDVTTGLVRFVFLLVIICTNALLSFEAWYFVERPLLKLYII